MSKPAQNSQPNRGRPFTKGQSGNPGGRPKTAKFSEEVREYLARRDGNKTKLEKILYNLEERDPKILLYYAFGKPAESVEISGRDGQPLIDPALIAAAQIVAASLIK